MAFGIRKQSFSTLKPNSTFQSINAQCSKGSQLEEALDSLYQQGRKVLAPQDYASLLQTCTQTKAISEGTQLHAHMLRSGIEKNRFLETKLRICVEWTRGGIPCNVLQNARGYTQNGCAKEALQIFCQMQEADVKPSAVTMAIVLPACTQLADLKQGYAQNGFGERDQYVSRSQNML
ncbi:hypothetical protein SUGI_1144650 [Cryptomeria japonica]|nr:hypothetical protein SUGI_1144650 [Cryptomeria japonica]